MKFLWPIKMKTASKKKRFSEPYRYANTCKGLKSISTFILGLFGKKSKAADRVLFAALMAELTELREAVTKLIGAYECVVRERDELKHELAGYKESKKGGTYEKRNEKVSGASVPERP